MCPQITGAMVRGQPVRMCPIGIKLRLLGLKASVFTFWAILVAQGQISKERSEPMSVDLYMRHLSLSPPHTHKSSETLWNWKRISKRRGKQSYFQTILSFIYYVT